MVAWRKTSVIAAVCMVGMVVGCTNTDLVRTDTPEALNLTYDELRGVQYFVAEPVTLERVELRSESHITGDRKVRNQVQDYEKNVVIEKRTPGQVEAITVNNARVRVADDIVLGFKPDLWSLDDSWLDSLGLAGLELDSIATDTLALDTLRVNPALLEAYDLIIPYRLVTFNGQPVVRDSLVHFRDEEYRVRYGYYGRGREWVDRPPAGLMYVRKLKKERVREIERVQGIEVSD